MQVEFGLINEHIHSEAERARALRVAQMLLDSGTFKEGRFRFVSGVDSPMKIEMDALRANPFSHREVSRLLGEVIKQEPITPRPVVGVIGGGVSFAMEVGKLLHVRSAARLGASGGREKAMRTRGEKKREIM